MAPQTPQLAHNIDRLVVNGRRIFGWGWAAHPEKSVCGVHLRIAADGGEVRLPANRGLARDDVEAAFPDLVDAGSSGFIVSGFARSSSGATMSLEIDFADGTRSAVDVTAQVERLYERARKRRMFAWLAKSVWRRVKRGDFAGLLQRAKSQELSAASIDDDRIVAELLPHLAGARGVLLVFDHNMGGGANQYRRRVIDARLDAGDAVILCTYNLPTLDYRLQLTRAGTEAKTWRAPSFLPLEGVLRKFATAHLFVNSPVSFDEPLLLADWVARMKADHPGVRVTVTVHDYFAVCPSFVLLDADGGFCGIPEVSSCAACLKRHDAAYVALSPPTEMGAWRALWGRCLAAADEVRCFSEASRALVMRAYPGLPPSLLTVVPHALDFAPARRPRVAAAAPLVIGVIGEISPQKGAHVVEQMLGRIDRDGLDVRVVVIGVLHSACKSPRLRVTGPYRRDDLVELVEHHGINMVLFPSVWPETFSYVVGEVMAMDLPLVAFDMGAPAERMRGYRLGRICPEVSGAAALEQMIAFHRDLSRQRAFA